MQLTHMLVALALAAPAGVCAQDLGAAAAKEKQRREEAKRAEQAPGKALTDDDLATYGEKRRAESPEADQPGPNGQAPAEPRPSPKAAEQGGALPAVEIGPAPSRAAVDDGSERKKKEQAAERAALVRSFRRRHEAAQERADAAEQRLRRAEDYLEKVKRAPMARLGTRERAEADVDSARQDLEKAKDGVIEVEDDARRAGLYPGDLR